MRKPMTLEDLRFAYVVGAELRDQGDDQLACASVSSSSVLPNVGRYRPKNRTSVSIRLRRRSVRPLGHRNHELGDWLGSTIKLWIQQNRGTRHACTPSHSVCQGKVKHEMGNPVPGGVVQAPLPRHHIAHPARFEGRQLLVLKFFDAVDDLSFGQPSQYQVCPLQSEWQNRSCGWRIKAERAPILGVPKLGTVE